MEKLFEEQENLYEAAEQIENELFRLTGFYFPRPRILYFKVANNEITLDDFDKAFNLMFEYRIVERKINVINVELEDIKKELK